jgi:hypothetical protein
MIHLNYYAYSVIPSAHLKRTDINLCLQRGWVHVMWLLDNIWLNMHAYRQEGILNQDEQLGGDKSRVFC